MRKIACIVALIGILACAGIGEAQASNYVDKIAEQDIPGEEDHIGYAYPSPEVLSDPNEAEFKYLALDERGLSYTATCSEDARLVICELSILSRSSEPQLVSLSDFSLVSAVGVLYSPSLAPLVNESPSKVLLPDPIALREGQNVFKSVAFQVGTLGVEPLALQIVPMMSFELEPAYLIIEEWQKQE
jgi:hypothetical protein